MSRARRYDISLRWVDLDAQGHVNNAALVDLLQEARVRYLLQGPNAHLLGHGIVVVGHQVEYVGSIGLAPASVGVDVWITDVGASRFTVGYEVTHAGAVVAHARTHVCLFDFDAQRPARLTPDERETLRADATSLTPFRSLGAWRVGEHAHVIDLAVRWSDLDSYGHVNNARSFGYFGEARVALMGSLAPDADRWLVARQDISYVGQIAHRLEPYRVRTAVAHVGRTSVTLAAEIVDPLTDAVNTRAMTVLVHADAAGVPAALPHAVIEAAQAWPAVRGRAG